MGMYCSLEWVLKTFPALLSVKIFGPSEFNNDEAELVYTVAVCFHHGLP